MFGEQVVGIPFESRWEVVIRSINLASFALALRQLLFVNDLNLAVVC